LDEINQSLLDPQEHELFLKAYPISQAGNFEGMNILQRADTIGKLAEQVGLREEELYTKLKDIHSKLYAFRNQQVRPLTDDKVLVSWNALALRALAEAARYLNRPDYLKAAQDNASFLLREMYPQGKLLRAWRNGAARHNAYLEDYAGLILGLLELYQSDPAIRWYEAAVSLAEDMLANFRDPQGGFFDTRNDHGELITRPKDIQDNATPSGNALAAAALLRLCALSERADWRAIAEGMLTTVQDFMVRHPTAFAYWLQGMDFAVGPVRQIAVVGPLAQVETRELLNHIWHIFRPRTVSAVADLPLSSGAPSLLRDRVMIQGKPTVYICEGFTCNRP
ncbi:MAG: thioredoxin domain-containing protein, partial [Anaerolineaceae bacterium]|nr:thioredoxin domain-containing protein [Anaerolineaceae bacterium]